MGLTGVVLAIGALVIAANVAKALHFIGIYILPSKFERYLHRSSDGRQPWALVTGASDGIGRAFAEELALRGFNVVLHGRNREKLSLVMSKLQQSYPGTSFRLLIADASTVPCLGCLESTDQQRQDDGRLQTLDFTVIKSSLKDLYLTVLINNAGAGPVDPVFASLSDSSAACVTGNISLNALFPVHLMRILLPCLAKNAPALVLNISSLADQGLPLLVSYGASKQFLISVTRAVRLEMAFIGKTNDVECLGIRVGKVTGVSHSKEEPSLFNPAAKTMARAALDRAGRGHGIIIGYWAHALQQLSVSLLPEFLADKIFIAAIRQEREEELRCKLKHT